MLEVPPTLWGDRSQLLVSGGKRVKCRTRVAALTVRIVCFTQAEPRVASGKAAVVRFRRSSCGQARIRFASATFSTVRDANSAALTPFRPGNDNLRVSVCVPRRKACRILRERARCGTPSAHG